MAQVWIVEDDEDIREIALYALRSAGFEAEGFENGDAFFAMLENKGVVPPGLAILDIMLPGDDGLVILKRLRRNPQFQSLPIIMLTAKSSEHDKVKGLDLGADDYLTKPFGVMELISRIKALLRRSNPEQSQQFVGYQNIRMNHLHRTVTVDGAEISFTFKEYELLHYLLVNAGIVLNRDKILETVWGYEYEGESRTLDMHIKRLRQKLGAAGKYIKTIRNVGYKLGE
ncbi:MAG: response regulator transcription factor [Defluviitaleaceae bacterium]|nr:response regulator transcription factor [Defluviitaleaceae bacterium]